MPQKQVKMSEKLLKNACFCGIIHRGMCTSEKFKQKAADDTAETAQEWYSQLCAAVTKAKQEYAVALADEAIAQEIYDSFLKEQETSKEESSSSEESSEEQTSPSTSQESQAQTQTQSQTPSYYK